MGKRSLRVALLHYSAPPAIGGVEFIVAAHATLFAQAGYAVAVITGEGEPFDDRVPVRRIPELSSMPRAKVNSLLRSGEAPRAIRALRKKLERELRDFDVCACHNLLSMHFNPLAAGALARLAQRACAGKFIAWVHDATLLASDYSRLSFEHRLWDYLRRPVPNVRYVTISRTRCGQIAQLFGIPEERIAVVPDGVDSVHLLDLTPRAKKILREERLDECDIVALTPTRIVRRKNLEAGIELISKLKKTGSSLRWLITGVPDRHNRATMRYFEKLQKMVKERRLQREVRFLGAADEGVDFPTLRGLYRLCDFLLLPSSEEGFGIPIIEAALARRLVVASDIPVLRELAGPHAIYLDPENVAETAQRIIAYLAADPPAQMYRRVMRRYTWSNVFKRDIEPLFLRAAREGRAAR